jgi:hypothetical protein
MDDQFIGTFPSYVYTPKPIREGGKQIGWVTVPAWQQVNSDRNDPNAYHPLVR